jgi:hypothetical protein
MNAVTILGEPVAWGVRPEWATAPILNLTEGMVVRRRFRNRKVGVAFVRCGNELRQHYLGLAEGGLILLSLVGINRKEAA